MLHPYLARPKFDVIQSLVMPLSFFRETLKKLEILIIFLMTFLNYLYTSPKHF